MRSFRSGLACIALSVTTFFGGPLSAHAAAACGTKGSGTVRLYIGTYGQMNSTDPSANPGGDAKKAAALGLDTTQGIYTACFDERSGHLSMLMREADVQRASWMILNPKQPVLYSTGLPGRDVSVEGNIYSYKIDAATGTLQPFGVTATGGTDPTTLDFDASSMTLFVGNHNNGTVGVFPVAPDGTVGKVAYLQQEHGSGPSPRQTIAKVHGVNVDPARHFVLTADFGADRVFVYAFDGANRTLTPAAVPFVALPPGSGPRHLAFQPKGSLLALDNEMTGTVVLYRWHADNGSLQTLQTLSPYKPDFAGAKSAGEMEFSPDGRFLYLTLRGDENSIVVYMVVPESGMLTEIQRIPAQGITPWHFAFDPTGRWMIMANVASNALAVFKVDPTSGMLQATTEHLPVFEPDALVFFQRSR